MCGMIMADMGAEVILVERKGTNPNAASIDDSGKHAFYKRGKRSIVMNLKQRFDQRGTRFNRRC